jgi:hypothetical protein
MEYKLCASDKAEDLNKEVNKLLADGWALYGGPFCWLVPRRVRGNAVPGSDEDAEESGWCSLASPASGFVPRTFPGRSTGTPREPRSGQVSIPSACAPRRGLSVANSFQTEERLYEHTFSVPRGRSRLQRLRLPFLRPYLGEPGVLIVPFKVPEDEVKAGRVARTTRRSNVNSPVAP